MKKVDTIKLLKRKLFYLLNPELRLMARRVYYFPLDLYNKLSGKRGPLEPPSGMNNVGPGDFKKTGELLLGRLIEIGGLKPDHRLLDIGCGIGRIAIPLTNYLNEKGSYEGFDIVKPTIKWCQKKITTSFPRFNFIHVDLKNDLYNLSTDIQAKDFVFPYADREFDLVIATSLFTHMTEEDTLNYLKEINRTLKPGGKCFASFFILTEESRKEMLNNDEFNFKYKYGHYSLMNPKVKEANIAFEEDYLFNNIIAESQLNISQKFYGYWSGRPKDISLDFQDTLLLEKK